LHLNCGSIPVDIEALALAVGHGEYLAKPIESLLLGLKPGGVVIDVKPALDREAVASAGYKLWRL